MTTMFHGGIIPITGISTDPTIGLAEEDAVQDPYFQVNLRAHQDQEVKVVNQSVYQKSLMVSQLAHRGLPTQWLLDLLD